VYEIDGDIYTYLLYGDDIGEDNSGHPFEQGLERVKPGHRFSRV